MTAIDTSTVPAPAPGNRLVRFGRFARRNPTMLIGAAILIFFVTVAIIAPLIAGDPMLKLPTRRLQPPSPNCASEPTSSARMSSHAPSTAPASR